MGKVLHFKPLIDKVQTCQTTGEFTVIFPKENEEVAMVRARLHHNYGVNLIDLYYTSIYTYYMIQESNTKSISIRKKKRLNPPLKYQQSRGLVNKTKLNII